MYGNHGNSDELKLVCPFATHAKRSLDVANASKKAKPISDTIGFSHIFGMPEPKDRYRGRGLSNKDEIEATQVMLLHLSQQISSIQTTPQNSSAWENPNIPAGYTYLLQLVFHDLTQTASALPSIKGQRGRHFNLRRVQLELETIFGGGPDADPTCYEAPMPGETSRTRLKLGRMDIGGSKNRLTGPYLDLPRISTNQNEGNERAALNDVLIADPRNDDNAILSQLTSLFHHFHNAVLEKLLNGAEQTEIPPHLFMKARGIVVETYRNIILKDVLKKILHPVVYEHYCELLDNGHSFKETDMPLEFAHAVCRFGHTMIRPQYVIRDTPRSVRHLRHVIKATSSRRPHAMPLKRDWIVQWSRFFDMTHTVNGVAAPENFSARIRPHLAPALATKTFIKSPTPALENADGLLYRDFIRGAAAGLWSVGALRKYLKTSRKSKLLKQCTLLKNNKSRALAIKKWLSENGVQKLSPDEIETIANDPPFLFYVLFEASQQHNGLHLGMLGSLIVAEVLFSALAKPPTYIGPFQMTSEKSSERLNITVFDNKLPENMPELIKFVAEFGPSVSII